MTDATERKAWRDRFACFAAYMRDRGWRQPVVMIVNTVALPGVITVFPDPANDCDMRSLLRKMPKDFLP